MSLVRTDRFGAGSAGSPNGALSHVRESFPALPDAVPAAGQRVPDFAAAAGASGSQLEAIRLATSEAMANAVRYAYPARDGHIHVTARVAGGELWMLIADNGCGIH